MKSVEFDVPEPKPVHMTCKGCGIIFQSIACVDVCVDKKTNERKKWTPGNSMSLADTIDCLQYISLSPPHKHGGFHPHTVEIAKAALFHLQKKPADEPRFTATQFADWLSGQLLIDGNGKESEMFKERNDLVKFLVKDINDPHDGIAAVTNRKGK